MSAAQYTPGPWQWSGNTLEPVDKDPSRSAVYSILDREGGFGFMASNHQDTCAELEANYALIAVAPEMFEILKVVARVADGRRIPGHLIVDENSPIMGAIRDVLLKVSGQPDGYIARDNAQHEGAQA